MQVFLQYSVFSGRCDNCTKRDRRFSTSFRDLTLDISKVRDYNGHIKNEGGARDEAFCNGSDESVEPYRCCCVRTGLFSCLPDLCRYPYLLGHCHLGCVHFCLPDSEPYRTCRPCSACTCTCGTHYQATEYGRKQKCGGLFRNDASGGIGANGNERLCFLQSRYCFDFMLCKTQLKNISQRGKK